MITRNPCEVYNCDNIEGLGLGARGLGREAWGLGLEAWGLGLEAWGIDTSRLFR